LESPAGALEMAAPIEVVETKGEKVRLAVDAWRKQKGYGPVLYEDFGRNIRLAVLNKETAQDGELIQVGEAQTDEATGLDWSQVRVELWAESGSFVPEIDALWNAASETYYPPYLGRGTGSVLPRTRESADELRALGTLRRRDGLATDRTVS